MHDTDPASPRVLAQEQAVRAIAIAYPEAHEDFPWGERALKVRGKVFLFMRASAEGLGLSVKLPHSNESALDQPFTEPTGYGLGKSGWVSARFDPDMDVPLGLLRDWIDESYRAVAPKRLVATLDAPAGEVAPAAKKTLAAKRQPAAKKASAPRRGGRTRG
jgi:predicted DNA-binding protein (MmcQ/YjbR family)